MKRNEKKRKVNAQNEEDTWDSFEESQDLYAVHRIVRLPSKSPFTLSDEL